MGWSCPTPWNTAREAPERELAAKIDAAVAKLPDVERAIFNFHAPYWNVQHPAEADVKAQYRPHQ